MSEILDDLFPEGSDPEPDAGTKPDDGAAPTPDAKDKKFHDLEEKNKDLREQIRQQGETIKAFYDWKQKITGDPEQEDKKKKELELVQKFEQNPLGTVDELIEKRLGDVKQRIAVTEVTTTTKAAMDEIDKEFEVDWSKDSKKILDELNNFSRESKQKDPKKTLLKACRLAGAVKKREYPPYIESSQNAVQKKKLTDEASIHRKRIKESQSNKKGNSFGI